MIRHAVGGLLLCLVAMIGHASAETAPDSRIAGIRVGLDGRYKPGLWTPVAVTLGDTSQLGEGRVALTVPDGDGVPSVVSRPIGPGDDAQSTVLLYVKIGRVESRLTVTLFDGDRVVAERDFEAGDEGDFPAALNSDQALMVEVGPGMIGVEEAVQHLRQERDERSVVAHLPDCTTLPSSWYGYEGVDTVLLSTSDPTIYSADRLTDEQLEALEAWIRLGGRLVLCVGREAEAVLGAGSEARLARFLPGRFETMESLRQTARALEVFANSLTPIPSIPTADRIPMLVEVEGTVELRRENHPLVVRQVRGFGQIIFFAADLDVGPLSQWGDRRRLVAKLLDYPDKPNDTAAESRQLMHFGYTDMAGQMRSALDRFEGVSMVPFAAIVAMIVIYVLAIGPGDYFFLRRFARRMELTWVTFPLMVVLVSVGAYFLAHRLKGDQVRTNQIDLVDVDVASGRIRATKWATVFSPKMQQFDISVKPWFPNQQAAPSASGMLTSWLGLPGSALGGMNGKTSDTAVWREGYEFSDQLDAIRGIPIQVWGTKSLTARWTGPATFYPQADLHWEDRLPNGKITNTLDFPLVQCVLVCGSWAYELGTLEPGDSVRVEPTLRRLKLSTLLTGRHTVFADDTGNPDQEITPYDQGSADEAYVLRAMLFFDAAGGRTYTRLSNNYQNFVDLSHLLKADRAVLVGLEPIDAHANQHRGGDLLLDGQPAGGPRDRQRTIYRFVFPVTPENGG